MPLKHLRGNKRYLLHSSRNLEGYIESKYKLSDNINDRPQIKESEWKNALQNTSKMHKCMTLA